MYRQQIEKYFEKHKDEMIEDICRIVRIRSVREDAKPGKPFGDGPAAVLDEFLKIAREHGFAPRNLDNYVGIVDLNDLPRELDILAHLDIVPEGSGWTVTKPFEPNIVDGKIYGRGTSDDKGALIAALYAIMAVREIAAPLVKNVRLVAGTDEECGFSDIDYYFSKEKQATYTLSPDADFPVINIEKGHFNSLFTKKFTDNKALPRIINIKGGIATNAVPEEAFAVIESIEKNVLVTAADKISRKTGVNFELEGEGPIKITAKGVSAHAAAPQHGKNAITAIIELLCSLPFAESDGFTALNALSRIFPHGDWLGKAFGSEMKDFSGELTVSFNIFEYNEEGLSGKFDSRTPICANESNLYSKLTNALESAGMTLVDTKISEPHYVPEDSPFIKKLLSVYENYSGEKGFCIAMGGGTYVHGLKNGVSFGPGLPGFEYNAHGKDEFAVIEHLLLCGKIYAQVIIDLCSQ